MISCSIHPYFKIQTGKESEFKALCEQMFAKTKQEPGCLYYGFSFNGDKAFCREAYVDADALLAHAENVADLFPQALMIAELTRVEIHASPADIEKLREPFADLNPEYFTVTCDFKV